MKHLFTSGLVDINGGEHVIDIYNRLAPATPQVPATEFIMEAPGYQLRWDAGVSDVVTTGICSSELTVYARNLNNVFDGLLLDLMSSKEGKYLIKITKNSQLHWVGVIVNDFSETVDLPVDSIVLRATDGTGLLDAKDVVDPAPGTRNCLLEYILLALAEIPTSEFYSTTDAFLYTKTDWFCNDMQSGREPLELVSPGDAAGNWVWRTRNTRQGIDGTEVVEDDVFTMRQQLQQILTRFNAILLMKSGRWYIVQRDLLTAGSSIEYYGFTKEYPGSVSIDPLEETTQVLIDQAALYRSEGMFTYMPGLKSATVTYLAEYQSGGAASNMIPDSFDLGDTYTSTQLQTGTGNKMQIIIKFIHNFDTSGMGTTTYQAEADYELVVEIGGWYLTMQQINPPYSGLVWVNNYATLPLKADTQLIQHPLFTKKDSVVLWKNMYTPDLPATGTLSITLNYVGVTSVPPPGSITPTTIPSGAITPTGVTASLPGAAILNMYYIVGNQSIVNYITFQAINPNQDFSMEYILEDSVFGSAAHAGKGLFHIWNGSQWILAMGNTKFWEKGAATSPKDLYFNELLINEVLSNQIQPLLIYNGTIHDRGVGIDPLTVLQLKYQYQDGNHTLVTYRMIFNQVTYSAQDESWNGDWFEIYRTKTRTGIKIAEKSLDDFLEDVSGGELFNEIAKTYRLQKIERYVDLDSGDIDTHGGDVRSNTVIITKQANPIAIPAPESGKIAVFATDTDELKGKLPNGTIVNLGDSGTKIIDIREEPDTAWLLQKQNRSDNSWSTVINVGALPRLKGVSVTETKIVFTTEDPLTNQEVAFSDIDHNKLKNYAADRHRKQNYDSTLKAYKIDE